MKIYIVDLMVNEDVRPRIEAFGDKAKAEAFFEEMKGEIEHACDVERDGYGWIRKPSTRSAENAFYWYNFANLTKFGEWGSLTFHEKEME